MASLRSSSSTTARLLLQRGASQRILPVPATRRFESSSSSPNVPAPAAVPALKKEHSFSSTPVRNHPDYSIQPDKATSYAPSRPADPPPRRSLTSPRAAKHLLPRPQVRPGRKRGHPPRRDALGSAE